MIYFVRVPSGNIKIGTTINYAWRRSRLAANFGKPIELLALIPGWEPEEKSLHQRFDNIRIAREIFRPEPCLLDFIASLPDPVIRDASAVARSQHLLDAGNPRPGFHGKPKPNIVPGPDDWRPVGEAARALKLNPHYCKGLVHGLGIRLELVGRMLLMSPKDFARLRHEVETRKLALPHNGRAITVTSA